MTKVTKGFFYFSFFSLFLAISPVLAQTKNYDKLYEMEVYYVISGLKNQADMAELSGNKDNYKTNPEIKYLDL